MCTDDEDPNGPPKRRLVVARPEDIDTREGLAAFFMALTGREPTEAELDEAFEAEDAVPSLNPR